MVDLWVCPNCNILQGIEVILAEEELKANCVSCGIELQITDVSFINPVLARTVIEMMAEVLPPEIMLETRFSWLSNQTVGIIFETPRIEVEQKVIPNISEFIEDKIRAEIGITASVYFE